MVLLGEEVKIVYINNTFFSPPLKLEQRNGACFLYMGMIHREEKMMVLGEEGGMMARSST